MKRPRTQPLTQRFFSASKNLSELSNECNATFAVLKDEPEDLTHLAPTAGDVCVPLDDPPFLSDMLDEFILNGNYCPLLSPDLPAGPAELGEAVCAAVSPLKDVEQTILGDPLRRDDCGSSDGGDPFIYRDSPSRCSLGTDLHSPTLTKVRAAPDRGTIPTTNPDRCFIEQRTRGIAGIIGVMSATDS